MIASNNSIVACGFVAIGTRFLSNYLAKIGGIQTHKESRLTTEEVLEAMFYLQSDLKSYIVLSSQSQQAETYELEDLITKPLPSNGHLCGASLIALF
jgi:hypothetical protein